MPDSSICEVCRRIAEQEYYHNVKVCKKCLNEYCCKEYYVAICNDCLEYEGKSCCDALETTKKMIMAFKIMKESVSEEALIKISEFLSYFPNNL